ncbi:hypothetical protein GOP56_17370 [Brevibacillus sp. 7WMA2]|nr:hypothetical protein GOP56_17370 [Brevibacillus sp. 7WMA2]
MQFLHDELLYHPKEVPFMENTFTSISKRNFVAIVEVNNPPANALSSASIAELRSVFHKDIRRMYNTG